MGLFDHFPYTNVHELNLDWVLSMMKALEAEWDAFTAGNSLTFADPLQHDISKTYAKNTIVLDNNGNAYVSLQAVPVGVALSNQDYWLMVFDYEAFIEKVNKNFTARYYRGQYRATAAMAIGDWLTVDDVLCKATAAIAIDDVLEVGVNIEHFTLEDFIKAFMQSSNQLIQQYKNDIDASELAYRQQLAQDIATTTENLQAQLNQIISGATVDSEVIDARAAWTGASYTTLKIAIDTQMKELCTAMAGNLITPSYTTGKFIRYDGVIDTTAGFQYSEPIALKENDLILVNAEGYLDKVSIITECDSNGDYLRPLVLSSDSTLRNYIYCATHDCYVIASGAISKMVVIKAEYSTILKNMIDDNKLSDIISTPSVSWSDGYISALGVEYSTASGACKKSSVIHVKGGDTIFAKAYMDSSNISIFARKNADGTFTPQVISVNGQSEYYFTPSEDMDIVVSSYGTYEYYVKVFHDVARYFNNLLYEPLNPAFTTGKYVNKYGSLVDAADYQYSAPIELNENDTIYLYAKGYLVNIGMISECTSDGTYMRPIVISIDSSYRHYKYTATHHCYVIVSGYIEDMKVNRGNYSNIIANTYDYLDKSELADFPTITWSDGFISAGGTEYSSTSGTCRKSSPISVKGGDTIFAKAYMDSSNISIFARKNANGTFTPLVISINGQYEFTYTAPEDMDIVVSSYGTYEHYAKVYHNVKTNPVKFDNFSMFEIFGVVGDSYASGTLATGWGTGYTKYSKSWPAILSRMSGSTCNNFSEGGLYCRTWLTDSDHGLPALLSTPPCEIYLLTLGINDAYHSSSGTIQNIGTIADITDDYTQNPDTFYGNYGKIIESIMNYAPNAKFIIMTTANINLNFTTKRNASSLIDAAIKEIASHYNIPCIDLAEVPFFKCSYWFDHLPYEHPTAPLYSGMAATFKDEIEKTIYSNMSYFNDIFFN